MRCGARGVESLVQAVQTAELVMVALCPGVEVADFLEADPALAPDSPATSAPTR